MGKIGIPDSLLLKPSRLSGAEFERIKAHTTIGARLLSGGQSAPVRLAEIIALSHHKRWDGGGYPRGLAGAAIPLEARIVAVVDAFDVLTHARLYKEAWPWAEAVAELERQKGKQFDPRVVEVYVKLLGSGPAACPEPQTVDPPGESLYPFDPVEAMPSIK